MDGKNSKLRNQRGRDLDPEALCEIRSLLEGQDKSRDRLIELLHAIQDAFGQLAKPHLVALADLMKLSAVEVFEVASFYKHFDIVENRESPACLSVRVCDSITCEMFGAEKLLQQLQGLDADQIRLERVPCVGRCADAPVAVVHHKPVRRATAEKIRNVLDGAEFDDELPCPRVSLDAYVRGGGYSTLLACVNRQLAPDEVIGRLEDSGLRGLGGAGFGVGRKWRIVRNEKAPRLMAVNIDEGEPGTFKDRYFLERNPHQFLEGMLIAASVVGIASLYIYIRDEYTALRQMLGRELDQLRNYLQDDLPQIEIRRGAGAYVCGEESAMIESIEGRRGMPRHRPPYVAQVGLFGRPTLEHNMESLYWVREILERGADWFRQQGRNGRRGLRSFSVSGRVKKPGVHIAPAGITVVELIEELCGGMLDGHEFRAYFPGGASGGILPASLGNIPLDFDTLQEYGCFIGSAAIIVLSQQDSVVRSAQNAMNFFAAESCGQCTPCRVGTHKAALMMQQESWDFALLSELSQTMIDASICGLGQAAPNPLLCLMRYFSADCPGAEGH